MPQATRRGCPGTTRLSDRELRGLIAAAVAHAESLPPKRGLPNRRESATEDA
jgi:hypothetical protein